MKRIILILLVLLSSCSLDLEQKKNEIPVTINMKTTRGIVPQLAEGQVAKFFVYGKQGSGEFTKQGEFPYPIVDPSINVPQGEWIFKLQGLDVTGTVILESKETDIIKIDGSVIHEISFQLDYIKIGQGSVNLKFTIPTEITFASIEEIFIPYSQSLTETLPSGNNINWTGNEILFTRNNISAGDYYIGFRFLDNMGNLVYSYSNLLIVANNLSTQGSISFNQNSFNKIPIAPNMLMGKIVFGSSPWFDLRWQDNSSNEMEYLIYWNDGINPETYIVINNDFTMYKWSSTDFGKIFNFSVTARNKYGESPRSNNINLRLPYPSIKFNNYIPVPGGTFEHRTSLDSGTNFITNTVSSFFIGQFAVTYELWYTVRLWAEARGYSFLNLGKEGLYGITGDPPTNLDKFKPVTYISWQDIITWINAYNEREGLSPIYFSDPALTSPIKNSTVSNPYVNWNSGSYRLPTESEWQYAASWDGGVTVSDTWTPWNWASGANGPLDMGSPWFTEEVAWFNISKIEDVGKKRPNQLNLFDMNGNINEFVWDWENNGVGEFPPIGSVTDYRGPLTPSLDYKIAKGGAYNNIVTEVGTGNRYSISVSVASDSFGFRLARKIGGGYILSFSDNNASSGMVPPPNIAPVGQELEIPFNNGGLEKLGVQPLGWNTKKDGTGTFYSFGEKIVLTQNTILYAHW